MKRPRQRRGGRPPVPTSSMPGVFGTFGERSAGQTDNAVIPVLALVVDALAYELDEREDDWGLATSIDGEDSQLVAFRRGLLWVRDGGGWVSERAEHLESRIEKAYREHFGGDLPPLGDDDGAALTWIIWRAKREAEK